MTDRTAEPSTSRRVCPTCGTRVGENATRCVVCGADLRAPGIRAGGRAASQISLSMPVAIALLAAFALLSAGLTFAVTRFTPLGVRTTPTASPTGTATLTPTPQPTFTETPVPTPTALPPVDYKVVAGDTCSLLAYRFSVTVRSILDLNNLTPDCVLAIGTTLKIPQPTPTSSPMPTETLAPNEATAQACEKATYTVVSNDTLGGIAKSYNVDIQAIRDYNSLSSDVVFVGQALIIPLCHRLATPGPTPTNTVPPPYPAPNLLLPRDGDVFTLANDTVTLQWAAVGQLLDNESYQVLVEDITEGSGTVRLVAYATDTKYILPTSFRPNDPSPHIMRWWVTTVRQSGTDANGNPVYVSAGAVSSYRDFSWSGAAPAPTSTP